MTSPKTPGTPYSGNSTAGFTDRLKNMKFMKKAMSSDLKQTEDTTQGWTGQNIKKNKKHIVTEDASYLDFLDSMTSRKQFQDFASKEEKYPTREPTPDLSPPQKKRKR